MKLPTKELSKILAAWHEDEIEAIVRDCAKVCENKFKELCGENHRYYATAAAYCSFSILARYNLIDSTSVQEIVKENGAGSQPAVPESPTPYVDLEQLVAERVGLRGPHVG